MNIVAKTLQQVPRAYSRYYSRLADEFVDHLSPAPIRTLLEVGCGKGQLTLPLLGRLPERVKLIALDSSSGPYSGWLDEFSVRMREAGLAQRVRMVRADSKRMGQIRNNTVDAIISNEFLCDLPRERQLKATLAEFHRVLKPRGVMVHGEWSSWAGKNSQALMIKHWPSWSPDQLFALMREAGFSDFHVTYFDTTINFGYRPALEELRGWGASESLLKKYRRLLKQDGILLPFEHIVRCRKQRRKLATNL